MPTKTRSIIDTHRANFRMTQWPITALEPFDVYADIVEQAARDRAAIDRDDRLAPKGKVETRAAKRDAAVKAIKEASMPRLAGLDADVAAHRAALIPASTEKPDARRIDFLLAHLRDRTPREIATFYGSATDDEKLALEEAARSVGRVPMKHADGSLTWTPLLPAETINEAIAARATEKNPEGAAKLRELEEIRAMHASLASIAAAEVGEIMSR